MKAILLGTGASAGVPMIGCNCEVCTSTNPKNIRSRVSLLVETATTRLLIDTSPDLRQQALANGFSTIDAILYTHAHSDHTHGIDDLRSFNYHGNRVLPAYGDAHTLHELQQRFPFAFTPPIPEYGWHKPSLVPHVITAYESFMAGDIRVLSFEQLHGRHNSLGFRFGDLAYSTDVKTLPEAALSALRGVDTWIVDCLKYDPTPTHAHLALTLEWIKEIQPRRAILTHMSHEIEYETLKKQLPPGVEPGWDGMVVYVK